MDAEMDKIADKEVGMEPGHAAGEAGGWCKVVRRRSGHGLRGPVQGVQRMGAGRHVETVGKKMFRELARAASDDEAGAVEEALERAPARVGRAGTGGRFAARS